VSNKRKDDQMSPAGEASPLMTNTPVLDAEKATVAPDQERALEVGGQQPELFDTSDLTFDPARLLGALSAGVWAMQEGSPEAPGYNYKITTASVRGRVYPVAVAVTPADAAVLAQAKQLLALVVQAFGMGPEQFAANWQDWRREAVKTLLECRDSTADD
jgi:hypothetical protein